MAIAKKIGCVLIVCLLTALCAVQAFADPAEIYSGADVFDLRAIRGETVLVPTGGIEFSKVYADTTETLFSVSRRSVDGEGNYITLLPDYTYRLSISMRYYIYNEGSVPNGMTQSEYVSALYDVYGDYLYDKFREEAFCPIVSPVSASVFDFSEVTDYLCTRTSQSYGSSASSNHGFGIYLDESYDVVFRTPGDLRENYFNSVGFVIFITSPSEPGSLTYYFVFSLFSFSYVGVYDPEGEVYDDTVDQIIQGQKDAIIEGQEREREEVNQAASDASDDGQAEAASTFNFSSYSDSLTGLISALGYTGTDFHFNFPAAGNIPYVGDLWSQQEIPLKQFIDSLPPGLLYVLRFLAWLALLFSVVHTIRKLISDLNGGDE